MNDEEPEFKRPKNPCTAENLTPEEKRWHRLYYRRNRAARYELSAPHDPKFDRSYRR